MISFLQNLLGKSKARVHAPPSTTHQAPEPSPLLSTVEVAHLRLATILERIPDELKPLVLAMPDESATVALPIATILKQLPGGAVKVSLATLHRQAPAGVLGPLPPGDKRMVEVPLAEIFRHIKPTAFKRRADQRTSEALDSEFNLFGDSQNPYQIAPTAPDDEPVPQPVAPPAEPAINFEVAEPDAYKPELRLNREPAAPVPPSPARILAPPPDFLEPKPVKLAAPIAKPADPAPPTPAGGASIALPVGPLCGAWPEPIRQELAALNGSARVTLPAAQVSAGLARGRVTFTWGQICGWLEPSLPASTGVDISTELTLPLKVVAPAFLSATKAPKSESKSSFETDIPALFNDARGPAPAAVAPAPTVIAVVEPPPAAPASEPTPAVHATTPQTVGDLFDQPGKTEWTPAELVANLANLPGISGAVVALQEGLVVAHSLPGDVKSEIIAAFLPQIFGRLNQYSAEMKLGEVDDLLFTTHGAHCQIYRLGFVYFAVLGKPGEPLPWAELRLVADELARQTAKP